MTNKEEYVYSMHVITNDVDPRERIFKNKADAIAAAWEYVASGYDDIKEEHNTESSLVIFANNVLRNLDTYVMVERFSLE